jgi:hypothetical protein
MGPILPTSNFNVRPASWVATEKTDPCPEDDIQRRESGLDGDKCSVRLRETNVVCSARLIQVDYAVYV